ncbi:apolipoprotein N-acyltransferase [Acrocarpospora pleiomorpha]|uniref:Apolipoprotein N-acyltransferase n=1 Tax=Acrocarpospora pleiomorpha TaxID=90975 RepID=A0A5M3XQ92_9ACTN|nr:nitrilase-related carbon-nitrogen hydrolase [Acrocarpospora pleiomorpha]GES21353.1 apolipoprotein N-acyltransferase [Acrocarpospora pleiomorpha]
MATNTTDTQPPPDGAQHLTPAPGRSEDVLSPGRRRHLWLALGLLLQLFAVGGRWDLPLAAWAFQIFLIRFLRTGRPVRGLAQVWLVCVAGGLFWAWQLAVPITLLVFAGVLMLSSVALVPFAADRLLSPRLGPAGRLLAFPAALTAVAYLLGSYNPFGTAYGLLAVTQHENLALLQVLSVAGPYSVAFLIGAVATAANHVWEHGGSRRELRPALAVAAVVAVVIASGQAWLAFAPAPSSPTVRIAGINPSRATLAEAERLLGTASTDLAEVSRADATAVRAASNVITRQLFADTREAAASGAKIVFWSENAAKVRAADEPAFLAEAAALARQEGIYLNIAANVYLPDEPYGRDQTVLLGPDGGTLWTYQKRHPIPGLERYIPGEGPAPVVQTPYGRLSNVICYDADFPAIMHVDADIMLVPGGDWPEMGRIHTKMASLRAIENGYALVRQDFNGSSQAFDRQGRVLSQQDTTPGVERPWIVDVPTRGAATLYRVAGDIFAWLCAGLTLAAIGLAVRRPRTHGPAARNGNA